MMNKQRIKRILDIALTLLLGVQMAYSLVGEASHEITGLCMLALLALHHALNGGFHRRLFRGRYSPYRGALTAIDAAMLLIFLMQGVSGLAMAKHVTLFSGGLSADWARKLHLLGAYWGFALCGVHAGLHMTPLVRRWQKLRSRPAKILWALAVVASVGYGIFAFVKRGLPGYMTLKQQFVFFDFGEPLAFFFIDYAFMMASWMAAGCAAGWALTRKKN